MADLCAGFTLSERSQQDVAQLEDWYKVLMFGVTIYRLV
jgi:hypothetical protein